MMKHSMEQVLIEQIRDLVHPILSSLGLELFDIEQTAGGRRAVLRIYIDKPGGVTLKDCEETNKYLGHALDVEDTIPYAYTLEVSSPGLDRPLKKLEDYQRAIGKLVRIKFNQAIQGRWVLVGRLMGIEIEGIKMEGDDLGDLVIPFSNIKNGRLEVEW